ncbi:restriction endonuclease subunit S [Clostridium sp. UBA5119]|uniref:restriction endonuclease subunit S n=1 Tax=Clostridium sp. UBA5119 TaxID=1946366 RepID=UPI00321783E4
MEYKMMKLGDIATFVNGYAFKPNEWDTKGFPIIRIQNLNNLNQTFNYYSGDIDKKYLVAKGDILISWSASIGVFEWDREDSVLNQHIFKVNFDKIKMNTIYFKFMVSIALKRAMQYMHGSTMKHITKGYFDSIEIPVPSLEIQQKIATILDKAQSLIDKRKEQIEACDELVKSRFIEMFGDPINNPMGWEVKKLKTISTKILSGNTPKGGSEVYVDEGIMFFRSQNVWKNKLVLDDIAYIDETTHSKMSKSSLKNKDILMTKTGRINTENSSLGRAAMFTGEDDSANINGHVYLIRLKKDMINEFVLFILTTNEYREYIRSVCVGGIDKRQINKEHLEEFPIIIPPIELQNQFANFVKQADKLKFEMEQSLKELENNFNSLMQRAFKGELF